MSNPLVSGKPLSETFNTHAACMREAFPDKLSNLVILSTKHPIYISPDVANHLTSNLQDVKALIAQKHQILKRNNWAGLAAPYQWFKNRSLKVISLDMEHKFTSKYPDVTPEMNLAALTDHELGHLVVSNGMPSLNVSPHMAECAADAFAAIRHVQLYGSKTGWFKHYNRSYTAVFDTSPIHYTSSVIQKVELLRKTQDLSKLSLQETAALAAKLATHYSLDKASLMRISQAFKPVGDKFKKMANYNNPDKRKKFNELSNRDQAQLVRDIAKTILDNRHDHNVYRAGRLFLSGINIKAIIKKCKKDPFWIKTLAEMQRFEQNSGIEINSAKAIDNKHRQKSKIVIEPR